MKKISYQKKSFQIEMEIFKTDYLKKEFEKFQKEDLVAVLSCGYCQKTCCKWKHNKFLAGCKYQRENFCKNCHKLKRIQKHFYWGLIQLVEITYKTL